MKKISKILIKSDKSIRDAFNLLEETGLSIIILVDDNNKFIRTITDGDLRRKIIDGASLDSSLQILPFINSITISSNFSRREALELMNQKEINHLPVVNDKNDVVDLIDRRDIDKQILLSVPHMGSAEQDYINDAFESNWIAPLGPNVDAFEKEISKKIGIKHAAAVSSGTAAIHLALLALEIKKNDKVFCSALTFAASAFPIIYQGAEPIFIDSDYKSWNMCPLALEKAFLKSLKEKKLPKAVIVVNLYGQSADMHSILEICNKYNVPVIEDAAESLGAKYKNSQSGSFGKISCFSFNGNKIITTSGGGMLLSNDIELVNKSKFFATQAREDKHYYHHKEVGYNYRMSNILAGVGRGQLKVLNQRVGDRRKIFEKYKNELSSLPFFSFMPEPEWSFSTRWLSVLLVNKNSPINTSKLIKLLSNELIEARHVWKPMQLQPIFKKSVFVSLNKNSVSEELFNQGICLPSSSNMTDKQQDFIIESIKKIFINAKN